MSGGSVDIRIERLLQSISVALWVIVCILLGERLDNIFTAVLWVGGIGLIVFVIYKIARAYVSAIWDKNYHFLFNLSKLVYVTIFYFGSMCIAISMVIYFVNKINRNGGYYYNPHPIHTDIGRVGVSFLVVAAVLCIIDITIRWLIKSDNILLDIADFFEATSVGFIRSIKKFVRSLILFVINMPSNYVSAITSPVTDSRQMISEYKISKTLGRQKNLMKFTIQASFHILMCMFRSFILIFVPSLIIYIFLKEIF